MFLKAMRDLIGGEVVSRDVRVGALDDLYLDGECWQVRYLVVATGARGGGQLLVSTGCVDEVQPHGGIVLELSATQLLEGGAGVWPVAAASTWLDEQRVCSGCDLLGFRVDAQDGAAGRLADLLLDEEHWCVDYLVIDAAEPGGRRQILLPLDWVSGIDLGARSVRVQRTLEELRDSPHLDG